MLIVPSSKSLVLSSHHHAVPQLHQEGSQPSANQRSLRISRRLLSETAILTVHRFPAPGLHTKRTVALAEMFRSHPRRLLEATVRCHGPTSVQALRRVVPSQIPLQLCRQATSDALDRVPGPSRATLIYTSCIYGSELSPR